MIYGVIYNISNLFYNIIYLITLWILNTKFAWIVLFLMQLLTRMGWPLSHSCFAYWKLMIFTCNPMFEQCISMDSTPWIRSKQICAASFFSATRTTVQRRRSTVTECSAPLNPWVEPTISKIQVTHNHLWLYCLLAQLFSQSKWGSTLEKSVFFFFFGHIGFKVTYSNSHIQILYQQS